MKTKFRHWVAATLILIGVGQVFSWFFDLSDRIEATFSESAKYELLKEKYDDYAGRAYSLGRFWGEETAKGLEDEALESNNITLFASQTLSNRTVDFLCFGPDDCGDLPTEESLKKWFKVDWGSENMPIKAFRSGYIDAFVEYLE